MRSRPTFPTALGVIGPLLLSPATAGRAAAQATVPDSVTAVFIEEARAATHEFRDRSRAVQAGFRRLGPDFPGMGEHWIHPGRIVSSTLRPGAPSVLSYVDVGQRPVLVGVAFAIPLAPDRPPPLEPFGREAWHDHTGSVEEETILLNSVRSVHGSGDGYRLAMVHVWTGAENPAGVLAQNNWSLPYLRVGLQPPDSISVVAARGVSLAYEDGAFYAKLIRRAVVLEPAILARIDTALGEHAAAAGRLVEGRRAGSPEGTGDAAFEAVWRGLWRDIRSAVPDDEWKMLSNFAEGASPER
jgi:hypothetical protein